MQHYKNILLLTIFLLKINKVVNYIFIEILKDGGYTGLFCLAQDYIDDKVFKCVKSNTTCTGMGKAEWNDPTVPLNMNYYNGTIFSCNVPCDYNENVTKINGSDEYFYFFIQKTLSVINITNYVKNGEIYNAYIKQLNITDPSNVTLLFNNPLFTYTNVNMSKNNLEFNLQVNDYDVYNTKFISKFNLKIGNLQCRKYIPMGYVFLYKDDFDHEGYINKLKGEYENKIKTFKKMIHTYQKQIEDTKDKITEVKNKFFFLLVIFIPIIIFILVSIILLFSFKKILSFFKEKDSNKTTEENPDDRYASWFITSILSKFTSKASDNIITPASTQ